MRVHVPPGLLSLLIIGLRTRKEQERSNLNNIETVRINEGRLCVGPVGTQAKSKRYHTASAVYRGEGTAELLLPWLALEPKFLLGSHIFVRQTENAKYRLKEVDWPVRSNERKS